MMESVSMLFNNIICRRKLDEERGNPWICECPVCRLEKVQKDGTESESKKTE